MFPLKLGLTKDSFLNMVDIAFYHLTTSPIERVLPVLLQKTLDAGKRAVVAAGSIERVESISSNLWTSNPGGWLPHGSAKEGKPEHQPIWLTTKLENPNAASYLFLIDGVSAESFENFERCFDLFDGNNEEALQAARARWDSFKGIFDHRTYWVQNNRGIWEKRATA